MPSALPYRTSFHALHERDATRAFGDLAERSDQATVFSEVPVAQAFEEVLGRPARIAAVWEEDRMRAGLLLFEKRRGPYRALALPPLVPTLSPLLDAPLREADIHARRTPLDALLHLLAREYHQATLVLHPSLADVRPFQWAGWRVAPTYTYRFALSGDGPMTAGWSSNPKRVLRQAEAAYQIEEGRHLVHDVIALVEASHRRQEQPLGVRPEQAVLLAARLMEHAGDAYLARCDGVAEAGLIVLRSARSAYYWLAGSEPGPAMTVLVAHVLERLRTLGVAYFDFVGANTPRIAEFKRRFGAELVPAYRARLTTRPELRALDALRGL